MPHLSPLKWFNLYIMMIIWMFIYIIKMNFFMQFLPFKKSFTYKKKLLNWKI